MIRTIKINNQIRLFFWIFNFNRVKIRELKASENFEKNKFRQASEPILTIFRLNLDFRSCIFKGRRAATPGWPSWPGLAGRPVHMSARGNSTASLSAYIYCRSYLPWLMARLRLMIDVKKCRRLLLVFLENNANLSYY